MNDFESILLQYNPKIRLYSKKERSGSSKFYLSYFLPNGKQIKRPCHHKEKEAKRLMSYKERELLRGEFDELDQKKINTNFVVAQFIEKQPSRYSSQEAIKLFLDKTSGRRKPYS